MDKTGLPGWATFVIHIRHKANRLARRRPAFTIVLCKVKAQRLVFVNDAQYALQCPVRMAKLYDKVIQCEREREETQARSSYQGGKLPDSTILRS